MAPLGRATVVRRVAAPTAAASISGSRSSAPSYSGKSDAESERVWAAAATHALAAQWRAVSALSLEQLERAP